MEYAKVGNTDIEVSKLCIGCMSFGKAGVMHDWTPFAAMEDHYNLLYRGMRENLYLSASR